MVSHVLWRIAFPMFASSHPIELRTLTVWSKMDWVICKFSPNTLPRRCGSVVSYHETLPRLSPDGTCWSRISSSYCPYSSLVALLVNPNGTFAGRKCWTCHWELLAPLPRTFLVVSIIETWRCAVSINTTVVISLKSSRCPKFSLCAFKSPCQLPIHPGPSHHASWLLAQITQTTWLKKEKHGLSWLLHWLQQPMLKDSKH